MDKKLLLRGGAYSLFSFFSQGVNFILLVVLANYILPDEYGRLSLFTTVSTFLGYIIALSTQGYVSISYFKNTKDDFSYDFSSIITIAVFVTVLLGGVLLLFPNQLSELLDIKQTYLWLALLISISALLYHILLDVFRIKDQIYYYGLSSCLFTLLNFGLTLLFVINLNLSWIGRVYSQFCSNSIFALIGLFLFIHYGYVNIKKVDRNRIRTIIMWGLPLIPHSISTWLKQGCDRYIINGFCTIEDVGLFSFALNLVSIIIMIGVAFNSTNSVEIFKVLSNKDVDVLCLKRNTRHIFYIYIISTIIVCLGGATLTPIVLPKYTGSISYFALLSIYGFFQCLYFLYTNYLFYYKANKKLMYITFGTACLHLLLSYVLTRFSIYATCIIYIICQLITVLLVRKVAYELLKKNLNIDKVSLFL